MQAAHASTALPPPDIKDLDLSFCYGIQKITFATGSAGDLVVKSTTTFMA
jgi:hypothetical protein